MLQINAGSSPTKEKGKKAKKRAQTFFFHAYRAAAIIHIVVAWKKLVLDVFFNTSQYWSLFLYGEVCWKWTCGRHMFCSELEEANLNCFHLP